MYWLDQRGARLLAELADCEVEELGWGPPPRDAKDLFLDHLLATNDVRAAIVVAAKAHGFTIEQWRDERELKGPQMKDVVIISDKEGKRHKVAVVPDGYFVLRVPKPDGVEGWYTYHHFLEIDMGTVTGKASEPGRRDWWRKAKAYIEYYKSGKYQERYETSSLRVLTVTTSEKRVEHLKTITEDAGGKSLFWFTTFDQAMTEGVLTEPVWHVANKREGGQSLTW